MLQYYNNKDGLESKVISMSTMEVSDSSAEMRSHCGTCLWELYAQSTPPVAVVVQRLVYK